MSFSLWKKPMSCVPLPVEEARDIFLRNRAEPVTHPSWLHTSFNPEKDCQVTCMVAGFLVTAVIKLWPLILLYQRLLKKKHHELKAETTWDVDEQQGLTPWRRPLSESGGQHLWCLTYLATQSVVDIFPNQCQNASFVPTITSDGCAVPPSRTPMLDLTPLLGTDAIRNKAGWIPWGLQIHAVTLFLGRTLLTPADFSRGAGGQIQHLEH
jgi:hypothetical protein